MSAQREARWGQTGQSLFAFFRPLAPFLFIPLDQKTLIPSIFISLNSFTPPQSKASQPCK
jgi:hypothetical protein